MWIHLVILTSSLLLLATKVAAITYEVQINAPDTGGGARFNDEVGSNYTLKTLSSATDLVWRIFHQTDSAADRKQGVQEVILSVDPMDGDYETRDNHIHIGGGFVKYYSGDLKRQVTGIIYHEITHMLQWTGNGQAPSPLIEGIGDLVRLKAGYAEDFWKKPGDGKRWDQSHEVTAYFLDYCNSLRNGFVADLNAKMKNGYNDSYFNDLLGKSVDQLWSEYKAKYGH